MKRRNYLFKFGLSITLVFILPILVIMNLIIILVRSNSEEITSDLILTSLLIILFSLIISFIITTVLGYITYRIDKTDIIQENSNIITTGRLMINKDRIIKIKAKRFIFLHEFVIFTKPYKRLSMLAYYFYDKEELINFINEHKMFLDYIRKEDLAKLGINE